MNDGKTVRMDSSNFDSSWMKVMNTAQERLINNAWKLLDPRAAWNLWLETTLDIWRSAMNMSCDPFGLLASWVKVMEQVQERIYAGQPLPLDPFEMFREWYDVTSKPWSRTVEQNIASEQFLAFAESGLESYSHLIRTFHRASETYFKTLQLPTLSDIARVAELVVDLEEKIDTVEEAIEQAKEQQAQQGTTTMAKIADMERHLNQIQTRLERMLALLEKAEVGVGNGPATSLQRAATPRTRSSKKTQAQQDES
jgi:polyhydroxyalkanoic acid synthase PhaR subunit